MWTSMMCNVDINNFIYFCNNRLIFNKILIFKNYYFLVVLFYRVPKMWQYRKVHEYGDNNNSYNIKFYFVCLADLPECMLNIKICKFDLFLTVTIIVKNNYWGKKNIDNIT